MEYRNTTFFYDGESWEVELPVCRKCIRHRASRRTTHKRAETFKAQGAELRKQIVRLDHRVKPNKAQPVYSFGNLLAST